MAVSEGLLLLLLLSPRLAAEVVREGAEVTLHCPGDRLPQSQCSETSWVFSHGPIEELFTQEQSGSGVSPAPSSRLSLTEDCGLNIKHALPEDGGEYYCSLDYTDYTSGMSLSVVKLKVEENQQWIQFECWIFNMDDWIDRRQENQLHK
ncbi:unnamed protein product [Knipowitschia caucasica]